MSETIKIVDNKIEVTNVNVEYITKARLEILIKMLERRIVSDQKELDEKKAILEQL